MLILPKFTIPREVSFENPTLRIFYVFAHLPIVLYACWQLYFARQFTSTIPNSATLMLNVEPVSWTFNGAPYMEATENLETVAPGLVKNGLCRKGAVPVWMDCSVDSMKEACDELQAVPTGFEYAVGDGSKMTHVCSEICIPPTADTCFEPVILLETAGSLSVRAVFTKVLTTWAGLDFQNGNYNAYNYAISYPQMLKASVLFTYGYTLAAAPPWFFGFGSSLKMTGSNDDAVTVVVGAGGKVLRVLQPGVKTIMSVFDICESTGMEMEFALAKPPEMASKVNCFTDAFDFPSSLEWGTAPLPDASSQKPVCFITFEIWNLPGEKILPAAPGEFAYSTEQGEQFPNTSFPLAYSTRREMVWRLDLLAGNSFHRLPDASKLLLNLVSMLVLLAMPVKFTKFIATKCLGKLSQVYQRAATEQFSLPRDMTKMAMRILSSSVSFTLLAKNPTKAVSKAQVSDLLTSALGLSLPDALVDLITVQASGDGEIDLLSFTDLVAGDQATDARLLKDLLDVKRPRSMPERFFTPARLKAALQASPEELRADVKDPTLSVSEAVGELRADVNDPALSAPEAAGESLRVLRQQYQELCQQCQELKQELALEREQRERLAKARLADQDVITWLRTRAVEATTANQDLRYQMANMIASVTAISECYRQLVYQNSVIESRL
eukprot:TRINITY_DN47356_c0_g1_i1.p1 TRINITY_DN47356_c0_g1~~TRINITY_DN47356_c0_g1_i1.p1  ORF type:complete len:668 (-),score=99.78 TRINITY_DN47356_c0_g1_i1:153-2156(-)